MCKLGKVLEYILPLGAYIISIITLFTGTHIEALLWLILGTTLDNNIKLKGR